MSEYLCIFKQQISTACLRVKTWNSCWKPHLCPVPIAETKRNKEWRTQIVINGPVDLWIVNSKLSHGVSKYVFYHLSFSAFVRDIMPDWKVLYSESVSSRNYGSCHDPLSFTMLNPRPFNFPCMLYVWSKHHCVKFSFILQLVWPKSWLMWCQDSQGNLNIERIIIVWTVFLSFHNYRLAYFVQIRLWIV